MVSEFWEYFREKGELEFFFRFKRYVGFFVVDFEDTVALVVVVIVDELIVVDDFVDVLPLDPNGKTGITHSDVVTLLVVGAMEVTVTLAAGSVEVTVTLVEVTLSVPGLTPN